MIDHAGTAAALIVEIEDAPIPKITEGTVIQLALVHATLALREQQAADAKALRETIMRAAELISCALLMAEGIATPVTPILDLVAHLKAAQL